MHRGRKNNPSLQNSLRSSSRDKDKDKVMDKDRDKVTGEIRTAIQASSARRARTGRNAAIVNLEGSMRASMVCDLSKVLYQMTSQKCST